MLKTPLLKELVAQLTSLLPAHLGSLKKDFEKNCHAIISKTFNKFDLVTREEFDIQTKVLLRTREKLDKLEEQLREIETSLTLKQRKKKSDER